MSQLLLQGEEVVSTDLSATRSALSLNQRELLLGIVDWMKYKTGPNSMCHKGPGQLKMICCLPYILSCASQDGQIPRSVLDPRKPALIIATDEDCIPCLESRFSMEHDNKPAALLTKLGFIPDMQLKQQPSYTTSVIRNAFDATWFQVAPTVSTDIVLSSYGYCSLLPDDGFSVVLVFGKHKLSLTQELRIKSKFEQHNKIIQFVDPLIEDSTEDVPSAKYLGNFRGSEDSISTDSSSRSTKLMGKIKIDGLSKFKFYKLRRYHPHAEQLEKCMSLEKRPQMLSENFNKRREVDLPTDDVSEQLRFNSTGQTLEEDVDAIGLKETDQDFRNARLSEKELLRDSDDHVAAEISAIDSGSGTKENSSSHIELDSDTNKPQDCTEVTDINYIHEKFTESSNTTISEDNASQEDSKSLTNIEKRDTDSIKSASLTGEGNRSHHSLLSEPVPENYEDEATQLPNTSVVATEWEVERSGTLEQEGSAADISNDYNVSEFRESSTAIVEDAGLEKNAEYLSLFEEFAETQNTNISHLTDFDCSQQQSQWIGTEIHGGSELEQDSEVGSEMQASIESEQEHQLHNDNVTTEMTMIQSEIGNKDNFSHNPESDHSTEDQDCTRVTNVSEKLLESANTTVGIENAANNPTVLADADFSISSESGQDNTEHETTQCEVKYSGVLEHAEKDEHHQVMNDSRERLATVREDAGLEKDVEYLRLSEELTEAAKNTTSSSHQFDCSQQQNSQWIGAEIYEGPELEQDSEVHVGSEIQASIESEQECQTHDVNVTTDITVIQSEIGNRENNSSHNTASDHSMEDNDCTGVTDVTEKLLESSNVTVGVENTKDNTTAFVVDTDTKGTDRNCFDSLNNSVSEDHILQQNILDHSFSNNSIPDNDEHAVTQQPNTCTSVKATEWEVDDTVILEQDECDEKDDHYEVVNDSKNGCGVILEDIGLEKNPEHLSLSEELAIEENINMSNQYDCSQQNGQLSGLVNGTESEQDNELGSEINFESGLDCQIGPTINGATFLKQQGKSGVQLKDKTASKQDSESRPQINDTTLQKQDSKSKLEIKGTTLSNQKCESGQEIKGTTGSDHSSQSEQQIKDSTVSNTGNLLKSGINSTMLLEQDNEYGPQLIGIKDLEQECQFETKVNSTTALSESQPEINDVIDLEQGNQLKPEVSGSNYQLILKQENHRGSENYVHTKSEQDLLEKDHQLESEMNGMGATILKQDSPSMVTPSPTQTISNWEYNSSELAAQDEVTDHKAIEPGLVALKTLSLLETANNDDPIEFNTSAECNSESVPDVGNAPGYNRSSLIDSNNKIPGQLPDSDALQDPSGSKVIPVEVNRGDEDMPLDISHNQNATRQTLPEPTLDSEQYSCCDIHFNDTQNSHPELSKLKDDTGRIPEKDTTPVDEHTPHTHNTLVHQQVKTELETGGGIDLESAEEECTTRNTTSKPDSTSNLDSDYDLVQKREDCSNIKSPLKSEVIQYSMPNREQGDCTGSIHSTSRPDVESECETDLVLNNDNNLERNALATSTLDIESTIPEQDATNETNNPYHFRGNRTDEESAEQECGNNDDSERESKRDNQEEIQQKNISLKNKVGSLDNKQKNQAHKISLENKVMSDDVEKIQEQNFVSDNKVGLTPSNTLEQEVGMNCLKTSEPNYTDTTGITPSTANRELMMEKEQTTALQKYQDSLESLTNPPTGALLCEENKPRRLTTPSPHQIVEIEERVHRSKSGTDSSQSLSSVSKSRLLLVLSLPVLAVTGLKQTFNTASHSDKVLIKPSFEELSRSESEDANHSKPSTGLKENPTRQDHSSQSCPGQPAVPDDKPSNSSLYKETSYEVPSSHSNNSYHRTDTPI